MRVLSTLMLLVLIAAPPAWAAVAAQAAADAAAAQAAAAQTAAQRTVRIDGTKTARICGECDVRAATFPVSRVDGKPLSACEKPIIMEVTRDNSRLAPDEAGEFAVRWDRAAPAAPEAVVLTVGTGFRTQGTYAVLLSLLPKSRPGEPRETVQVILPAADLEVPEKLLVERTVLNPWSAGQELDAEQTPLSVREKGRLTGIQLLAGDTGPFVAGLKPVSGRADATATAVGRDSRVTVPYKVKQEFPLGVTTGSLLLRAPELKDPVKVPIEVRSRLSRLYLFFAILFGLLTSWAVKVLLARAIELHRVRAHAHKLLGTVFADGSRYKEPAFEQHVKPGRTALAAAVRLKDAAEIDRLRTALDAEWRVAVQAAETRRTEFRARAKAFLDLVSLEWVLPPPLRQPLEDARVTASTLAGTPPDPNIDRSADLLQTAQKTIAKAVFGPGGDWQQQSRGAFDDILDQRQGLPDALITSVSGASSAWRQKFPRPEPGAQASDAVKIEAAFRNVAGEYFAVRDAIQVINARLDRTLNAAVDALRNRGENPLPDVAARTAAVKPLLDQLVDRPGERTEALQALRALQQAWEDELPRLANGPSARDVRTLVKQGKFVEAAALAALDDPILNTGATPQVPVTLDRFAGSLLPLTGGGVPVALAAGPSAPYFALFISSLQQLRRAKAAQTAILGALFIVWAFGTHSLTWDGTWLGVRTVFFAAFGVDVATDALLTRLKTA